VTTIGFGSEFYRAELRWDKRLPGNGRLRTAFTLGFDQTAMGGERNAQDRLFGLRTEFERQLTRSARLRAGVDSMMDAYRITDPLYDDPDAPNRDLFRKLFPPRKDTVLGAHAEVGLEVQKGFFVTPGIRVDYYTSNGATAIGVDPRLSGRIQLSDSFSIVHAYGIAHQPPSFILPVPGLALGSLANGLQTAYQTSAGIEWSFAQGTMLKSTVFNNVFTKMTDALSVPEDSMDTNVSQRTSGRAYGFELFLHRRLTQDLGGFLSYTLSRSTRRLGNAEFPSAFDRRHVLSGALAFNLGRRWRAGSRLTFYTGAPKRDSSNTASATSTDSPTAVVPTSGPNPNPERDPAFYRLDVRLEKRWPVGKSGHVSFVAEWMNVTAHKEIYDGVEIGPISVPSLGVEGGF
jgi:hypothetical protein